MAVKVFKWGIMGTGFIANQFAKGLKVLDDAETLAVGSRTQKGADDFADIYGIPRRYSSYAELAHDPDIDIIYIATPNTYHFEHAMLCMEAGKAVLCEKPLMLNAKEAAKIIGYAREKKLFFMEAMWTRYLPVYDHVRKWMAEDAIGEVQIVQADFGFCREFGAEDRHLNMALGGGALLDVGVYPVAIASMIFGGPPAILACTARLAATGADEQTAILMGYEKGQAALLSCSFGAALPSDAWIIGTKGSIRIREFWKATKAALVMEGVELKTADEPFLATGYEYEAMEVMRCIRAGMLESPTMPLDESLQIMETMDRVRGMIGLKYPGE
jgi:dihydrodiol dehydrogenase / D-xylose 1-dehydrogenase (NADP)